MQGDSQAQRVTGKKKNDTCACEVNSTMWSFPVVKYEAVLQQVETCEGSLNNLQEQVRTKVTDTTVTFRLVNSCSVSPLILGI